VQRTAKGANSGIVHQNIQPIKGLLYSIGQRRHRVPVGNVARQGFALTTRGADLSRRVLQAGKSTSADNRGCAQAGQFERDCCAYATSCPGDKGNFAVQSMVHVLSILNFRKLIFKEFSIFWLAGTFSPLRCLILQDTASCPWLALNLIFIQLSQSRQGLVVPQR
jgi:hypothetical protein